MTPKPLLTPKEAGYLLRVPGRRVLRLDIPKIQMGYRTVRYRPEDVETFIQQRLEPVR